MAFLRKQHHEPPEEDVDVDNHADTPIRYVSLDRVYSSASLCGGATGSSSVMSKKVKARKLIDSHLDASDDPKPPHTTPDNKPEIVRVYYRRKKRPRLSFFDAALARCSSSTVEEVDVETEILELEDCNETADAEEGANSDLKRKKGKRQRVGSSELVKLGVDSSALRGLDGPRLRDYRNNHRNVLTPERNSGHSLLTGDKCLSASSDSRKWVR